jgi:hypothetical protein
MRFAPPAARWIRRIRTIWPELDEFHGLGRAATLTLAELAGMAAGSTASRWRC